MQCNIFSFPHQHPTSSTQHPSEASPPAPLRMERGVITEIPLYVIYAFSVSSPFLSRPIGVTSHTTPLSNRRGVGGKASVNSVCRRPSVGSKRWWKSSVKTVWSVREKNVLRERKTSFHSLHQFYQEIYPYFLRRKKRTNRKFIGTQIANIGIKANCLLSPNQRKSCRKVLCKT